MLDDSSAKRSEIPADELVRRAIAKQEAGNPDANAAVDDDTRALARRPAEALAAARRLCAGADTVQHIVAASLLGNIADLHRDAVPAVLAELERLLPRVTRPAVRAALASAFGAAATPEALPYFLQLKDDTDSEVRFAVVLSLNLYLGFQADARAVAALLALMQDDEDDVRDWATFTLGTQLASDTPEVRQALVERTRDAHPDTRAEAIVGLARRLDPRCLPPLIAALDAGTAGAHELEAATILADPHLLARVTALSRPDAG